MIIKEIKKEDWESIVYLNNIQKDFKLNGIGARIIDRIVYDKNKPIAYGIVKKLAEAIMLVDHKSPQPTRAKAMRELMKYAEFGAKKAGCEQLHCFCSSRRLADTLEHHFGFVQSHDIVLVKNL